MGSIDRVKKVISDSGLSVTGFAKKVGCTQSSVDRYIKGITKVPLEFVESILNAFPDISAEWLLRGEGDMYKVSAFVTNDTDIDFHAGLEELRRRVADLERQTESKAQAV